MDTTEKQLAEALTTDQVLELLNSYKDNSSIEIALRRAHLLLMENAEVYLLGDNFSIYSAVLHLATQTDQRFSLLPMLVLHDILDVATVRSTSLVVYFVDRFFCDLLKEPIFSSGRLLFIRFCNGVLKLLSSVKYSRECGLMHTMLSKYTIPTEKSGLNLTGQVNLEKIDQDLDFLDNFTANSFEYISTLQKSQVDASLYQKYLYIFNLLKDPLKVSLNSNDEWKHFTQAIEEFIKVCRKCVVARKRKRLLDGSSTSDGNTSFVGNALLVPIVFFSKISDSGFVKQILLQLSILLYTLNYPMKVQRVQWNNDQRNWLNHTSDSLYKLLERIEKREGISFLSHIKNIIIKENFYTEWKDKGCLSLPICENNGKMDAGDNQIDFSKFDPAKSNNLGHPALTRLWNICPDNIEACKLDVRRNIPSLESFFDDGLKQKNSCDNQSVDQKLFSKDWFQWRSLRLLLKHSPYYFSTLCPDGQTTELYLLVLLDNIMR